MCTWFDACSGQLRTAYLIEPLMQSAEEKGIGRQLDLTRAFVRLSNLPTYPLDRLSRYEATLWRQACQILFALQFLDRRKPWQRLRARIR